MTTSKELTIELMTQGDWQVLVVAGELDLYSRSVLSARIPPASGSGGKLAVDLTDVRFIDSSGLGTIVTAFRQIREGGGTVTVIAPSDSPVGRMLALTGLTGLISPVADRTAL